MQKLLLLVVALGGLVACGGGDTGVDDADDVDGGSAREVRVEIYPGFTFEGPTVDEATFVAVQDGDGPFVAVQGSGGLYTATIESGRFGIAVGCVDEATNFTDIEVVQRTDVDGLVYQTYCKTRPLDAQLDVTVTNLPEGHALFLRAPGIGGAVASADGVKRIAVRVGQTLELFGSLVDSTGTVVKFFRLAPAAVTGDAQLAIDVAATGGAPDMSGTFTANAEALDLLIRTSVLRPQGPVSLTVARDPSAQAMRYVKLPDALEQASDLYRVAASGPTGTVSLTRRAPGALAFTLPAAFETPAPELLESPFVRPVFTFSPTPAELDEQSYLVSADNFSDSYATVQRVWYATLSSAWIGDATQLRYEFPDFSGMPGFADLALSADHRVDLIVQRIERSGEVNTDGSESRVSTAAFILGKYCGDGVVTAPEDCDPGDAGESETCNFDCTFSVCGDGVVNPVAGEECEPPGDAAGECDLQCQLQPV